MASEFDSASVRIPDDAKFKLARNRAKVKEAIEEGGGTALYAAHILPQLGRYLPVLKEAGIRMVEMTAGSVYVANNPPSQALYSGGRSSSALWQHTVSIAEMCELVRKVRDPLGTDVYLNVTPPGVANVPGLTRFTDQDAFDLSVAGADGLHTHLSSYDELESLVNIAHRCGLMVEGYISEYVSDTDDYTYLGIPANSPEEVSQVATRMESIGVDIIGMLYSRDAASTSMDEGFYTVEETGESLPSFVDERLTALREAVKVPISIEGQVTSDNAKRIKEIGVDIIIIGSHFDLAIEKTLLETIDRFRD